jgi:hypothetical protein
VNLEVRVIKKIVAGVVAAGTGVAVWAGVAGEDHTTRDTAGVIQTSGDLGVFVTQLGDCMTGLPLPQGLKAEKVSKGLGVPCSQPHHEQVYFKGVITLDGIYDRAAVRKSASAICDDATTQLVPTLSAANAEEYRTAEILSMSPTQGSWGHGDRSVDCLIGSATTFYTGSIFDQ